MKPSRHLSALLALALAAPALTGCIQTPRPDPALDVPQAFSNAPRDRAAAPPRADWWKAFGSAELTRMVQAAEAENLDIAAAVARIQQADAQAKIAGSALLPVVDLSASTARSRSAALSGRGGTNGSNRFGSSLSASYELDFWGKNQSIRAAADQNALATRFDRDTVALTVAATTATTYVRILAAKDRRRIANQNLQSATRVLTIIRERLEVGTATALDLAQQESVVANLRANIPPLEQIIAQETATLAVLLGRAPERLTRGRAAAWTRSSCRASRPACPRPC